MSWESMLKMPPSVDDFSRGLKAGLKAAQEGFGTTSTPPFKGSIHREKYGWTDKFVYPPYKFKMCNRLITNFHQPKSTLMMLVAAFAGKDLIMKAYKEAIKKKYKFYSYGDSMLIIE